MCNIFCNVGFSEAIRVPSRPFKFYSKLYSIPNFYSGARLYPPPSPRVSSQVPALAKNCDLLGKILGLVSDHGSIGSDSEALTNFDTSIRQPRRPKQSTEIYDIAVAPSDD